MDNNIQQLLDGVFNWITEKFVKLDSSGKIPSSILPSYVDDVIEGYYDNNVFYKEASHETAINPETGKIYVDLSTNKTYRWGSTQYVQIKGDLVIGTTEGTAFDGAAGTAAAGTATDAMTLAGTAYGAANGAYTLAQSVEAVAGEALGKATNAAGMASDAMTLAGTANGTANAALALAQSVQGVANEALGKAGEGVSLGNTALNTANSALGTANTAYAYAGSAHTAIANLDTLLVTKETEIYAKISDVQTSLTNRDDYLEETIDAKADKTDLYNYYTKTETYSKQEFDDSQFALSDAINDINLKIEGFDEITEDDVVELLKSFDS